MNRQHAKPALVLGLASVCAPPAIAQTLVETDITLDPTTRHAPPAELHTIAPVLVGPSHTEQAFELLEVELPEIPRISEGRETRTSFHAGRSTTFIDGGLGDDSIAIDEATRRERAPGFHEDNGEFDVYDLSLSRDAWSDGPLTVSLIGGVRTVSVQSARRPEDSGYADDEYADGFVPVPVVGTGVRLDLFPGFYVSGAAATHTIPDYATMLDLTAQAGLQLHPNAIFQAGYQSTYSSVTVDELEQRFDEEGFFARLRIQF